MVSPEVEALMPTDRLMRQAWVDCLRWAAGKPEILERFRSDTGLAIKAATPLESMIDIATGRNRATAIRFIRWFNENIWGQEQE